EPIPDGPAEETKPLNRLDRREWKLTSLGLLSSSTSHLGDRRGRSGLKSEGGTSASQDAVARALDWLARHQSTDGSWRSQRHTDQCKGTCTMRRPSYYGNNHGDPAFDIGTTGLAMLAFSGAGLTHQFGAKKEYVNVLKRAVKFLLSEQLESGDPRIDGCYGPQTHRKWVYNHAIATLAMCELYLMSGDALRLRRSTRRAVELLLGARNPGRAWRYGYRPGDDDVSIAGWALLALKAAQAVNTGVDRTRIDIAIEETLRYLRGVTETRTGRTGYSLRGQGDNHHKWPGIRFDQGKSCMTSVSALCRLLGGERRSTRDLRRSIDLLSAHPPTWTEPSPKLVSPSPESNVSTINFYYWYHASYALFQHGGNAWNAWNKKLLSALVPAQRQDGGCETGSWDPVGEWANRGGRVYSTALAAMTLEVYYRFRRVSR
ncbi:MAG: hypothetical protein AAF517_11085, partial [Planctomycetota bacterium]